MSYYVKLPRKRKLRVSFGRRKLYRKEASLAQIAERNRVVEVAKWYRGQPTEKLLAKLAEMGYTASEKRIYQSGGVGSWYWLPKFGIFRIQVRASHISTKGAFMPYALCVEV